jgi:peroxiredoxin Q/BCP
MRRVFAAIIVSALTILAVGPGKETGRLSNRRAPGFSLMDVNYNQHDLADYRGRVVVIDFIRTDCPMCNTFAGICDRIRTQFGDKVAVLTVVNAPPDNLKTVQEFIERHSVKNPVLFDTFQMAASYMKLTPTNPNFGLPHLFLIDAQGQIRDDYEYEPQYNEAYFSGEAKPLIAEIQGLIDEIGPGKTTPKAAPKATLKIAPKTAK